MVYSPAFTFSSVYPLGFLPCARLRLWVLRQFHAFLASSAFAACVNSYHFEIIAPPRWRSAFSEFAPAVKLGFPFWRLGLTVQSSRPAFGGRLTFGIKFHTLRLPPISVLCQWEMPSCRA